MVIEVIVWADCKLAIGQVVLCQVTTCGPSPKLLTSSKVTRTFLPTKSPNAKNTVCCSCLDLVQHKLLSHGLNLVNSEFCARKYFG